MSLVLSSPPLSAGSRLSRRKSLRGFCAPWQRTQDVSKIGRTSRSKSIFTIAAGGSWFVEISAADNAGQIARNKNARVQNLFDEIFSIQIFASRSISQPRINI